MVVYVCCAVACNFTESYADSAERVAEVLGCLHGVHIMPLTSVNGEEEEGGVPAWVLTGTIVLLSEVLATIVWRPALYISHWHSCCPTEEPQHHATSCSDRQLQDSSVASTRDRGLSWLAIGLAAIVAILALVLVAAPPMQLG